MKISNITSTSLSFATANHQICTHCMIVDRDMKRIEGGYLCTVCKMPGDTGHMFFDFNILTLIDLIQEAYLAKPWKASELENENINSHSLSVLIFFCTLREVLLERLIYNLMVMHKLPESIRERLYDDNRTYSDKMNRLFPSLVGLKSWKEAISTLQGKTGNDYNKINDFLKTASDMRNEILHEGDKWAFEGYMKNHCLENIPLLLGLYVDFHNVFIHPVCLERLSKAR